jgi:hypothetical protein
MLYGASIGSPLLFLHDGARVKSIRDYKRLQSEAPNGFVCGDVRIKSIRDG